MRFQTLDQWLDWQTGLHPREIELGLERVRQVWQRLHPGALAGTLITVAGTNGKGSCVALLDAILRAAGYRTGCYTSPHLVRYNERVRLDGEAVGDARLCLAFERVDQARAGIPLTYFEFGTLAALEIFAAAAPEVIILEVGMGGRLDAVNILDPDAALIVSVGIDHTSWLGDDIEQIAREKAGIMRPGVPAVYGSPDPPASLTGHAEALGVALDLAGRDFGYRHSAGGWEWWGGGERRQGLPIPALRGEYQLRNAAAVLMLLARLRTRLPVDQQAVRSGLQSVSLAGRFQVLPGEPPLVLDVAHNAEAARVLADNLRQMPCQGRTLALFGMLADKDVAAVVSVMAPLVDHWFPTGLDQGSRGQDAERLVQRMIQAGIPASAITASPDASRALAAARRRALPGDRLLAFGSFHLVGQLLERK